MEEYHTGVMSSHLFPWSQDIQNNVTSMVVRSYVSRKYQLYSQLLQCTIGVGRKQTLPMKSIPVDQPFQIVGVDIMEPPLIAIGNRCATVFQDLFSKWPIVYAESGQEAIRLAKLLVKEIVPMFGIPEALLSDHGTTYFHV